MDQNQITNVDDDLQKAIDNITNTTNIDPVFSDPVAAPSTIPEGDTGELDEPVGPFPEPAPEILPPAPAPEAPLDAMEGMPDFIETPAEPGMEPVPSPDLTATINAVAEPENLSMHQIKEAALRDLLPLIDSLNMTNSQKFNIYRNVFESLKDYTVLTRAYNAAHDIESDTERAEALLYLIEAIDKM